MQVFQATDKQSPPAGHKEAEEQEEQLCARDRTRERRREGERERRGKSELANYRDFSVRASKFEAKLAHRSGLILV